MRKCVGILSLIAFISFTCFCLDYKIAFAESSSSPIKSVTVRSGETIGTASLFGNGETFITDMKVKVNFIHYTPYEIQLINGYSPSIEMIDFGGDNELLFCSSQTGGSGGYGNYQIYLLKPSSYKLIYDDKENSQNTTFQAKFIPNGFMKLANNQTNIFLNIDVKFMDKIFYGQIFYPNGNLKGVTPYVNDISFVSPSLNSASEFFRLITYRSVVAVAEVNRLGYIVQTLEYQNEEFLPVFTEFALKL